MSLETKTLAMNGGGQSLKGAPGDQRVLAICFNMVTGDRVFSVH